ncbi:hypothetical protein OE88DRAFT_1715829 [Heliocybe sulcata]|uniref:Snf7-domain-containing protein n=1 Tax=Heliocybe sulcata TaxID=5364 RepID=A0A5C3NKQ7_9AGAM|nr:hypothetical protein OE88DRAFT_1715829 [Heliocybe sulcata]
MGASQSTPKVTAQDRAILDLKLQRDKLKQYQKKIQQVLDREKEIARQHLAVGDKQRALIALRRRKYQESLLVKTDGQLESLEQLVSTIEFSLIEVSVLHGLKQGNEVLKEIHKEMNAESVEKLLEETAEAREYQREIDEMLSNNLTVEEEEAVEAELKALQAESVSESPPAIAHIINVRVQATEREAEQAPVELPSAPVNVPVAPEVYAEPIPNTHEEEPEQRERVPVMA